MSAQEGSTATLEGETIRPQLRTQCNDPAENIAEIAGSVEVSDGSGRTLCWNQSSGHAAAALRIPVVPYLEQAPQLLHEEAGGKGLLKEHVGRRLVAVAQA